MKQALAIIGCLLFLNSCISISISGFNSGYKKLSPGQQSRVVFVKEGEPICNIPNDKRIYAIHASQLLQCLKDNDTSVVYRWSPECHSKVCISLPMAQHYCDVHHYKLYVVQEYYDFARADPQNTNPTPLFATNHKYYKTDYCNKYERLFANELAGHKLSKEDRFHRFLFFKGDKLVFTRESLVNTVISQ